MSQVKDFETKQFPTWCPGCGNFGIWTAIKNALVEQKLQPHEVVIVFGIGCSGNDASFLNVNGFHGLHGRTIPAATGIKLANHKLKVLALGGDGDGYGIGLGHFIHAMRRNLDITYIVHNNQIYSLTKGQASPTSERGFISKSTPLGAIEIPINPLSLAMDVGATYVARGFTGNVKQLTNLIIGGMQHKGFALIDVLQPCVTYNHYNTFHWYAERVYDLAQEKHNVIDKQQAWLKANEWPKDLLIDESRQDRIPTGLFYQVQKEVYRDEVPALIDQPLVDYPLDNIDIESCLQKLT